MKDGAGYLADIHALTDPGADSLLGWDDSASAVIGFTLGAGLSFGDAVLDLATAVAGTGLTMTSQVLNVIGGAGITANADDIALTDAAADGDNPVDIATGAVTLNLNALTESDISATDAGDTIIIDIDGNSRGLPMQSLGVRVINESTAETFAASEVNTLQVLTGATDRAWTIPTNAAVPIHVGAIIYLAARDTGNITVTVGGSVTLTSRFGSGVSATDTVIAGGMAALVKVATDEWMLSGDIVD
jgi:hypothetical protein